VKHNTLLEYRSWLAGTGGLTNSTVLTYYKAVCFLLQDQYLLDCKQMDINAILDKLRATKHKGEYSKYKNAFLKLCAFLDIKLSIDIQSELDNMISEKKKKHRKLKTVKLPYIQKQIRGIRDKKLRLSFDTMLNTGLRVSELSQIKKEDCFFFDDDRMELTFIAKGGKQEKVFVQREKDKNFFNALSSFIDTCKDDEKIFYSSSYLQARAKEKGFSCHDLRRAFAKVTYRDCKDINTVQRLLRHSNIKNTKLYLKSKVKLT